MQEYFGMVITEAEIHPDIMAAASRDGHKNYRFDHVTKTMRSLVKKGLPTGFSDDKPKKGSSRAVFFPEDDHKVKIDGQEHAVPHVVKMAFSGQLDKHLPLDHPLLGQMQNEHEADSSFHHSVLKRVGENEYHTNDEGFLPPHFGNHDDHHWLHVGKIEPINSKDFREATKTADFPKGITHKQFFSAVNHEWQASNGKTHWSPKDKDHDKLIEHPLVNRAINFSLDTDTNPEDFASRNMGFWHNPATGKKHIVAADAGFSRGVAKAYHQARVNASMKRSGY
jgi:hypothetical protein